MLCIVICSNVLYIYVAIEEVESQIRHYSRFSMQISAV